MRSSHALTKFINLILFSLLSIHVIAGPLEENANKIKALAENGDAKAQSHLGYLYYVGEGVKQDYSKAVEWYRKAAVQGDKDAQYNLAVAYAFGEGIQQDLKEASLWYRRSAEQGHVISQYSLGLSYAYGEGVPQDSTEAVKWFQKAAEQGYVRAQIQLGSAYHTGEGVTQDYSKAIDWYRMAADRGDATAQYNLGTLYRSGKGVEQNYQQAIRWFTMAADQGYAAAQNELASLQRSAGRVATRPTPQMRPGSDAEQPGVITTPTTTTNVSSATSSSSPISTETAEPEQAEPAQTSEENVAVVQTPKTMDEIKAAENNKQTVAGETEEEKGTENQGGLAAAIGRLFSSSDEEPVSEPEAESIDLPDTDVDVSISQTPVTRETTIHKEITVAPEQVEVISNVPETDSIVRSYDDEATVNEVDSSEEPGFFSRLFGTTKKETEETTEISEIVETEEVAAVTAEPESIEEEMILEETDSQDITAEVEEETTVTNEVDANEEPEQVGFFESLFGSGEKTEAEPEAETLALASPANDVSNTSKQTDEEESKNHSLEKGRTALAQGDYELAITHFQPLAESGDAEAQSHLASMYYVGRAVDKDYKQAFHWYRQAADQGHIDSQYSIGNMYLLGEGIQQNNHLAALWYNKAAQQGHVASSHNLSSLKRLMAESGDTLEIPEETQVAAVEPQPLPDVPETNSTDDIEVVTAEVETDIETESESVEKITVISNVPETDAYVRNYNIEDQTEEDVDVNDEQDVEVAMDKEVEETEGSENDEGGISGFFSRIFGSSDEEVESETSETIDESENLVDETVNTEIEPVASEEIDTDESVVKTFGINNAPVSQQLSSEPDIESEADQDVENTLISESPEQVEADSADTIVSEFESVNEASEEASPESIVDDTDTVAMIKPEEESSFFEKLFGSTDSNTEQQSVETEYPDTDTSEPVEEMIENNIVDEEPVEEEFIEAEPVIEASYPSESTDEQLSQVEEEQEPGFFSRLFGTDEPETEDSVDDLEANETTELMESNTDAETLQTNAVFSSESPSEAESETIAVETEQTLENQPETVDVQNEEDFGFFDQFFGAEEDNTSVDTTTANESIALAPSNTVVSEEDIKVKEAKVEPVVPVKTAIEREPAKFITESQSDDEENTNASTGEIGEVRPRAIEGDAEAQLQLADMYYEGRGISKNYTQAFLWYRRAAQQENVEAQYKLGNIYLLGEGITPDDKQAALWYGRAADQGHAAAKHNYENLQRLAAGEVVSSNRKETGSVSSSTRPLAPGLPSTSVQTDLEDEYDDELPTLEPETRTIETNADSADEDKGFWAATGELLGFGDDEPQESGQTETRVEDEYDDELPYQEPKVVSNNVNDEISDAQSLYETGIAHANGDGVTQDYEKAADYFHKAAEQGHPGAQYRLGVAYAYGEGVKADKSESINWYRKAAQQGNTTAQRTLASMYLKGEGVPRDPVLAHAWFSVVADSGNDMDIRQRDMLQEELSEPELSESERIAREINSRL